MVTTEGLCLIRARRAEERPSVWCLCLCTCHLDRAARVVFMVLNGRRRRETAVKNPAIRRMIDWRFSYTIISDFRKRITGSDDVHFTGWHCGRTHEACTPEGMTHAGGEA